MSRVAIVGAGIGGLSAGLLLARDGHRVTILEADPAPVPATAEQMWTSWPRPGTPQARLGHSLLPGFHKLLSARLSDVAERIVAAGAPVVDAARDMPGGARVPEDADIVSVMGRRPVIEGILRTCAEAESQIEIRRGVRVTGLAADAPKNDRPPRVTGLRARTEAVPADIVIVAGGRSAPVGRWFSEIGAIRLDEQAEHCGFACYTRYFRLLDGDVTELTKHGDAGYLIWEIWGADNQTFAAEIAVPVADRPLHQLRHVAVWQATALALPHFPNWIDPQRSRLISSGMEVMGAERNVRRRFAVNDRPVALGIHVIGDARCQTDSLWAWGCHNALLAAAAVSDSVRDHPGDPVSQAMAVEQAVTPELDGRFLHSRERDRAWHRARAGEAGFEDTTRATGLIDDVLYPAAKHDADVYRSVARWEFQLAPADCLNDDAELASRARTIIAGHGPDPAPTETYPSRDDLLATMAAAS